MLIGHRGVGKSHFLEILREAFVDRTEEFSAFDLDAEVETSQKQSIEDIFAKHGEEHFRRLEESTLQRLTEQLTAETRVHGKEHPRAVFIALGAGYLGAIPIGWDVWWIRRETDSRGRILLDRPRLNAALPPLEEYQERFVSREQFYFKNADRTMTMPEGMEQTTGLLKDWILQQLPQSSVSAFLTLFKRDAEVLIKHGGAGAAMDYFVFAGLELRDDLLDNEVIFEVLQTLRSLRPKLRNQKVLLSFRRPENIFAIQKFTTEFSDILTDWPAEFGTSPKDLQPDVISFHEATAFAEIQNHPLVKEFPKAKIKLAIPIDSFAELRAGHEWGELNPERFCFLPRSENGRWAWYRNQFRQQKSLNFVRLGRGSSPDQPSLAEWLMADGGRKQFAAVLGDPVDHSRTPSEQGEYFALQKQANCFAIPCGGADVQGGALEILQTMGMKWAAVTSPLKQLIPAFLQTIAHATSGTSSTPSTSLTPPPSENSVAINTLSLIEGRWQSANTDTQGFAAIFEPQSEFFAFAEERDFSTQLSSLSIAIWGGSGTLASIQQALPKAVAFSLRTGSPRSTFSSDFQPEMVIWAVGRSQISAVPSGFPPQSWQPKWVVDLNYSEDSPGREYFLKIRARSQKVRYVSGLNMFKAQAQEQRNFWNRDVSK